MKKIFFALALPLFLLSISSCDKKTEDKSLQVVDGKIYDKEGNVL